MELSSLSLHSGASLINQNLLRKLTKQRQDEVNIVETIKAKMERIRNRHRDKLLSSDPDYNEPADHYEGLLPVD